MEINIFEKELLSTEPESEIFYNLFTGDLYDIDITKYRILYKDLSKADKKKVFKLAKENNKIDLYNEIEGNL